MTWLCGNIDLEKVTPRCFLPFLSKCTNSNCEKACRLKISKCNGSIGCKRIINPITVNILILNLIICSIFNLVPRNRNAVFRSVNYRNADFIFHILVYRNIKCSCHRKDTGFFISVICHNSFTCRSLNIFHILICIFILWWRADIKFL